MVDNLVVTGLHSTLVDELTDKEKEDTLTRWTELKTIEDKYRLLSVFDSRFTEYSHNGIETIYQIVLDNSNTKSNYSIWANGVLSDSLSYHVFNTSQITCLFSI
jgi:hypothetical protein